MSRHKIDDLFKGKLEGHKVTPKDELWTKLGSQMGNQKGAGAWWIYRVAAAVALIGLATIVLLNMNGTNQTDQGQQIANGKEQTDENLSTTEAGANQVASTDPNNELADTSDQVDPMAAGKVTVARRKRIEISFVSNLTPAISGTLSFEVSKLIVPVSAFDPAILASTEVPIEDESRTIIYKIGSLDQAVASADTTKESTIKKVWNFTKSLKNGEEKLFNLREMKNDLFASGKKEKAKNGLDTQIDLR